MTLSVLSRLESEMCVNTLQGWGKTTGMQPPKEEGKVHCAQCHGVFTQGQIPSLTNLPVGGRLKHFLYRVGNTRHTLVNTYPHQRWIQGTLQGMVNLVQGSLV